MLETTASNDHANYRKFVHIGFTGTNFDQLCRGKFIVVFEVPPEMGALLCAASISEIGIMRIAGREFCNQ